MRITDGARLFAFGAVMAAVAATAQGCGETTPPDTSCAEGKGNWLSDDNGKVGSKGVTVKVCVDDGGNVLDIEVE